MAEDAAARSVEGPACPSEDDAAWLPLFRAGSVAAVTLLLLIPMQVMIFWHWPPPTTALGFLRLLERDRVLGLLSLDLIYMVDVVLNVLLSVALCVALWRKSRVLVALALVSSVVGTATYFASNPLFSMLSMSARYTAAASEGHRAALLGATEGMLATYAGITNGSSYVIMALGGLLLALAMLRSDLFSKATAYVGLLMSLLMLVPSGAGRVGLVFAFASLLPLIAWLVLVARQLRKLGRGGSPEPGAASGGA